MYIILFLFFQSLADIMDDGKEVLLELCSNDDDDNFDQKFIQHFIEGVFEHYFSEHLRTYDESDLLWFFNYLLSPKSDYPKSVIKACVARFFFHRVLLKKEESSASTTLDIFDDKVS